MRRCVLISLTICCFVLIAVGAGSEPREGRDHLWWAERLLSELDDTNTRYVYQRHARGIAWKGHGSDSTYAYTDCSGFLNGLFQHVYGFDATALRNWLGVDAQKTGPTANRYYSTIVEQRGFVRITKMSDIRPGDILAILYPDDNRNTGHVMLIRSVPQEIDPLPPRVDHTDQWKVSVIDATVSPHGRQDGRCRSNGICWSGLGSGEIRLYGNAAGEILGYSWSLAPKSRFISLTSRPLAVGRFKGKIARK